MAQVSKYPIPNAVLERISEIFFNSLIELKTKGDAEQFIKDLLTPTERIMLAKRLAIAFLLEKDYDFRTIRKILRVSLPTIASVNLARKYGGQGYKRMMEKLLKEEKINSFFNEVGIAVTGFVGKGTTVGTGVWRYLHQELKKKQERKPF